MRYVLARDDLADEVFPDEVVLMDFGSGDYFSLRGAAAAYWPLLRSAQCTAALGARLPEDQRTRFANLIARLVELGLLAPAPAASAADPPGSLPPVGEWSVEQHSEMRDLMLLDPIHEVAPQGWPRRADGSV